MQAEQGAKAPDRGKTENDDEGQAGQAARSCVLAPSLEHGDHSNHKQQNCADSKCL
jgi:hypothetical protein